MIAPANEVFTPDWATVSVRVLVASLLVIVAVAVATPLRVPAREATVWSLLVPLLLKFSVVGAVFVPTELTVSAVVEGKAPAAPRSVVPLVMVVAPR